MPDDDQTGDSPEERDYVAEAVAAVDVTLSQAPASVRETPEYKALAKQARQSAREAGESKRREVEARTEAATTRQVAEAQRQAALEAQLDDVLGQDGIAAFQELSDLSETDPVAAARMFAKLMTTAQSSLAAAAETPTPPVAPEGTVPAKTPPPFPSGGVDGNAPLMTQGEDMEALTTKLDDRYAEVVARNQDPVTRNRVTQRERANGFISYIASAYVKATGNR